jgi:hypothetical protein
MAAYQTHETSWQGIPLSVSYCPDFCPAFREVMGRQVAHLTITAADRQPLPVTETGFRSHFTGPELVESEGGPGAFVLTWLDLAAQSPEWQARQQAAAQLTLF